MATKRNSTFRNLLRLDDYNKRTKYDNIRRNT